ncbi:MAG: hypothetical protein HYW06_00445, partial [Gemmatimonadetes bacterium]|nr:hypothetical protein [Gemmatimonadota bacterium]
MTAPTLANQATGRGPRLTATQVLMLRGLALFVACLLLVSTVRALAARGGTGEGGATYTGTAMVKELTNLRSSLDR